MEYRGQTHSDIFAIAIKNRKNANFRYLSVVYLLTADKKLWTVCKKAISVNKIDFSKIENTELSSEAYTLLMTAKDIYDDDGHVTVADLANKQIVSSIPIFADDRTTTYDTRRIKKYAKRTIYCNENRILPNDCKIKTLFQMGH
jgi:hypothetical protein